jgi:choline dehydrogenase-like flavoprotein
VTQRGRRWSTADAYLRVATERGGLAVETDALVTRILIDDGRAVGVRYVRDGVERDVRASREVVLSGGAINSPHLLMLSGIGPGAHLREHGIDVIVDAPHVGEGLQDHPLCAAVWRTPGTRNAWEEPHPTASPCGSGNGAGRWVSHGIQAGGFVRSRAGLAAPDVGYAAVAEPVGPEEAAAPWLPGIRTAVRRAVSSRRNGSSARGKITATARQADMVQLAGRDRSTSAKSPDSKRAWRRSCSITPPPPTHTSIFHTSGSDRRISPGVRRAPPALLAESSATRTAPT